MKLNAIIFDLDGTILDSMPYWRKENRHITELYGYPIDEELEKLLTKCTSSSVCRRIEEAGICDYRTCNDRFLEFMGGHYQSDIQPKPGVLEFLTLLHKKCIRVFLASATPVRLTRPALERHGLLSFFEDLFDNESFGIGKSEPAFFKKLCDRLNIEPAQCAMFEDSPYAVHSARAAGLKTFAIYDAVQDRVKGRIDEIKAASDVFVNGFSEAAAFID